MSHESAVLFDFSDEKSTELAREMLQQLGYEPVVHDGNRLHIHVVGADLTSALEIAQAHGGRLVEQSKIADEALTDSAYSLDAITIPAHIVNEDWLDAEEGSGLPLQDAKAYDYFSGDVHI